MKPRLLDIFCGAGGAAVGYARAGFDVVGVDNRPQPNYPFAFLQDDALALMSTFTPSIPGWWDEPPFAAIHASPPCQAYSAGREMPGALEHADLIDATRILLQETGLPYVIENVVGAPLVDYVELCGASLALPIVDGHDLARHRLFETNWPVGLVPPCAHGQRPVLGIYGDRAKTSRGATLAARSSRWSRPESLAVGSEAMGIGWMTWRELREAIPPAYTELIGHQLMQHIRARSAA